MSLTWPARPLKGWWHHSVLVNCPEILSVRIAQMLFILTEGNRRSLNCFYVQQKHGIASCNRDITVSQITVWCSNWMLRMPVFTHQCQDSLGKQVSLLPSKHFCSFMYFVMFLQNLSICKAWVMWNWVRSCDKIHPWMNLWMNTQEGGLSSRQC